MDTEYSILIGTMSIVRWMVVYSEKIGKAVTVTFSRREREAQEWLGKQLGGDTGTVFSVPSCRSSFFDTGLIKQEGRVEAPTAACLLSSDQAL
jgi:hypothetical protein